MNDSCAENRGSSHNSTNNSDRGNNTDSSASNEKDHATSDHTFSSIKNTIWLWVKQHKLIAACGMLVFPSLVVILPSVLATRFRNSPFRHHNNVISQPSTNDTAQISGKLQTWWHETGEINPASVVQPGNVRQSHMYSVSVSVDEGSTYYSSFVYETIPRNGQGSIVDPNDPSSITDANDGIMLEADLHVTMAWSNFHYGDDVMVKIHRLDGKIVAPKDVTIRSLNQNLDVQPCGKDVVIQVPYTPEGAYMSVEIEDDLFNYRLNSSSPFAHFVQNLISGVEGFVQALTNNMPIVGTEPRNSLLIFAEPFPTSDLIPDTSDAYLVPQGQLAGLDSITQNTIVFQPGVYWATGTAIANLSSSVDWVYFAPGSYVKGAIWFNSPSENLKATGPGVLSGEQYVYQANTAQNYQNAKSDDHSVRMWSGNVASGNTNTTLTIAGPTVNAPPFNSMDFRGNTNNLAVYVNHYKQVGAFFGQTDGLQAYPGSQMSNIFYHSNDDAIKTYYSNVHISNVTVWKGNTAPTIQFGWASRNLSNVTVENVRVIHSKYNYNSTHPAIIGANQVYGSDESDTTTAQTNNLISDVVFRDITVDGVSPCLFRIVPLANMENVTISDVKVATLSPRGTGIDVSHLPMWFNKDGQQVSIKDFKIDGFVVGGQRITYAGNNWMDGQLGAMWIDERFVGDGKVTIT